MSAAESDGYTTLEFQRRWDACDADDIALSRAGSHVIWSYQTADPADPAGPFKQHVDQGSQRLNLITGAPFAKPDLSSPDIQRTSILMPNVSVPANKTVYWCYSASLPVLDGEHVRYWLP